LKKKLSVLALTLLLLPLAGLAAQTGGTSGGGFTILSFDIGYTPFFDLGKTEMGNATVFGLNVKVADAISMGSVMLTTDNDGVINTLMALRFKYDFKQAVRFTGTLGKNGGGAFGSIAANAAVAGLGLEYLPFGRKNQTGVYTDFKISLDYLFDPAGELDKGALIFALSVGLGV